MLAPRAANGWVSVPGTMMPSPPVVPSLCARVRPMQDGRSLRLARQSVLLQASASSLASFGQVLPGIRRSDKGRPVREGPRRGGALTLVLAVSCGVQSLAMRWRRRASGGYCRRARLGRHALGDELGRSPLIRASWFPFPWKSRGQPSGQGNVAVAEPGDDSGVSPEEELLLLSQTGPQRVAMLGTRECPFQHQQEIELLSEARVNRGDHIFTSGSSGTNSSVIRGALRADKPHLLTVVLPQSFKKQDKDAQALLRQCREAGVNVQPMPQNDKLPLSEAARLCNTKVLGQVKKLVAFASHESSVYLSLIDEAKRGGVVSTAFFLD